jgi:hypothetical protein
MNESREARATIGEPRNDLLPGRRVTDPAYNEIVGLRDVGIDGSDETAWDGNGRTDIVQERYLCYADVATETR